LEPGASRSRRWASTLGWLGVGLVTAFVLWIPPLIDQLRPIPDQTTQPPEPFRRQPDLWQVADPQQVGQEPCVGEIGLIRVLLHPCHKPRMRQAHRPAPFDQRLR